MRSLVRLMLVGIFLFLPLLQSFAQTPLSILIGKVTDSRGRGVRGARVVLLYNNKNAVGEETTNARGEFRFGNLRPGNYNVAVDAQGLTQSGGSQPVKIMGGTQHVLSIALTVAALKDALIVSATRTESLLGETASSAYVVPAAN